MGNRSLPTNLELIKEIEELKLKQKILINSLKNKKIDKYEQLLIEITTKIDFLVKLFKDASEDTSETDEIKSLSLKIEDLEDKLESISKNIESKIGKINEKLNSLIESEKANSSSDPPVPQFKNLPNTENA